MIAWRRHSHLNMYAPSTQIDCIQLWQEIVGLALNDCKWIALGDWNMVGKLEDKCSLRSQPLSGMECFEFNSLKAHQSVFDFFDPLSTLRYSWDNKQQGNRKVVARLDRAYVFSSLTGEPNSHIKEYNIPGSSCHSDHLPISLKINLHTDREIGSRYQMKSIFPRRPGHSGSTSKSMEWLSTSDGIFHKNEKSCQMIPRALYSQSKRLKG